MLSMIRHRGPDEAGYVTHCHNAVGQVRLSTIDLTSGQQPMSDASGRYWIVYNGEVYNFRQLRAGLQNAGVVFQTNSDTEVVLYHYLVHGMNGLNDFNGQFAFVVYDIQEESLFMARDRVGITPLFYTLNNGRLMFASELKAFMAFPDFNLSLSPAAMMKMLTFWSAEAGESMFDGVSQVRPGHCLAFKNGALKQTRYAVSPLITLSNSYKGSFDDAVGELRSLLTDAVDIRMQADVPVGAYLSGGIDSSTTCQMMKEVSSRPFHTFSLGFSSREFDESCYQTDMLSVLESEHHSVIFNEDDLGHYLPKTIWHAETPLLRTGPVPMMKLSELVRASGIKTVITGEGSDEILGGYNIFKEALIRQFWARNPESVLRPMLLARLYPYLPHFNANNVKALNLFFGYRLKETGHPAYSHLLRWRNGASLARLLNVEWLGQEAFRDVVADYAANIEAQVTNLSTLAKAQFVESDIFLPGYLLSSQGDRMLMANSVEGRFPFLDHRVMEFAHSLPDNFKMKILNEKYILKKMITGRLPQSIVQRAKQPYRAPSVNSLLKVPDLVNQYLSPQALDESGVFDAGMVVRLTQRLANTTDYSESDNMALNALLTTQICHHLFVKKEMNYCYKELNTNQISRVKLS